jgi:hypothetical protein
MHARTAIRAQPRRLEATRLMTASVKRVPRAYRPIVKLAPRVHIKTLLDPKPVQGVPNIQLRILQDGTLYWTVNVILDMSKMTEVARFVARDYTWPRPWASVLRVHHVGQAASCRAASERVMELVGHALLIHMALILLVSPALRTRNPSKEAPPRGTACASKDSRWRAAKIASRAQLGSTKWTQEMMRAHLAPRVPTRTP